MQLPNGGVDSFLELMTRPNSAVEPEETSGFEVNGREGKKKEKEKEKEGEKAQDRGEGNTNDEDEQGQIITSTYFSRNEDLWFIPFH